MSYNGRPNMYVEWRTERRKSPDGKRKKKIYLPLQFLKKPDVPSRKEINFYICRKEGKKKLNKICLLVGMTMALHFCPRRKFTCCSRLGSLYLWAQILDFERVIGFKRRIESHKNAANKSYCATLGAWSVSLMRHFLPHKSCFGSIFRCFGGQTIW